MSKLVEYARRTKDSKTPYSYGDEWIYRMCQDERCLKDKDNIASAIWIIGRSYSASPERKIKTEADSSAEDFFRDIAEKVSDIFESKKIKADLCSSYRYDACHPDADIDILEKTIHYVWQLNEALKDHVKDHEPQNMVSFCSKFLHFFLPKQVFIIDQYSNIGSHRLFGRIQKATCEKDIEGITIKDLRAELELKNNCLPLKEDDEEELERYKKHVYRCYLLARYFHKNDLDGIKIYEEHRSMPRLIDTVLMNIGYL